MNVEIEPEAAQFPEMEYIIGIFLAVQGRKEIWGRGRRSRDGIMERGLEGQVGDHEGWTGGNSIGEREIHRIGEGWELGKATEGGNEGMICVRKEGDGGLRGKGTKREGGDNGENLRGRKGIMGARG